MEKVFDIHATLIDQDNHGKKEHFFIHVDTIKNDTKIYQLDDALIDETKEVDEQLKALFSRKAEYKMEILSDLMIRLVNELGGIDVDGSHIDGKTALKLIHEGGFDRIVDAIVKALSKKNLILTIPNLLNSLGDTYKTDVPLLEAIKAFIGEISELNDWKIDLIKVSDKAQIKA